MIKTAAMGIADHVPGDEIIGSKAHLVNDVKLLYEPFASFFAVAIANAESFAGELLEQYAVVFATGAVQLFVLVLAEFHVDGAGVDKAIGIGDDLRILAKGGEDIRLRDEIFVCGGNVFGGKFG